jgi:hypothetical protein
MKFCLPPVLVCWNSFQLYFFFDLRNFLFPVFLFDTFFLRFSLLDSSLISCAVFLISYIFFLTSLVSFWSLLKSSLSSFNVSVPFQAFYLCSLDII